jgi:iron complex outermembrane receptor protein
MKKHQSHSRRVHAIVLSLAVAATQPGWAAGSDPFFDLDLKEVLNLEITSVSKKPQTVSQAAAAVFVITSDEIRRSAATTLPELLRMAPGIQVAQISSNAWAVSARGPKGRFTNKLLVLMDGRSVYTPTFSGVYWDVQNTDLGDIDRIEVIRGPGAALWGANAVNGVINIITKPAAATRGGALTLGAGDEEKAFGSVRYGGEAGEIGHWRVYAKGFERDGSVIRSNAAPGDDDWRQHRLGFRGDLAPGGRDTLTLQGDYYGGRSGESSLLNSFAPPYNLLVGTTQKVSGWNLLGRWQRELSASDSFTLQGYVDHSFRDWPARLTETRDTYDLDFQYRTQRWADHDVVLGAGYRLSRDEMGTSFSGIPADSVQFATFSPTAARRQLLSAFVQDDIILLPRKLILTLGTKLERNDYTGVEHQPNLRLLWTPNEAATIWGAVARAVRTPSRIEREGVVNFTVVPPGSARNPAPLPALVAAPAHVGSEILIAYEAGWKQRLTPALSIDAAVFYNDYEKLRTGRFGLATCQPSGAAPLACFLLPGQTHVLQPSPLANDGSGRSYGVELAVDWRLRSDLRLQLAAAWSSMFMHEPGGAFTTDAEQNFAKFDGALRLAWNPRPDTDVDLALRRVSRLPEITDGIGAPEIPAYTQVDARLAWRPVRSLELALVGRNLLPGRHAEFASELLDVPVMQFERSVFGQINWKF